MKTLGLAVCAGLLVALPAAAHAHADRPHSPGAAKAEHDHAARPASETEGHPAAMRQRQIETGKHTEDGRCPCCDMMERHGGGMGKPSEGQTTEASTEQPETHQH